MAPGGHWKAYDNISPVVGNEGEDPGEFAFVANLDPNPNYPEARIVMGPPGSSNIRYSDGFALTYDSAGQMIDRLREIRRDMEIAGVVPAGGLLDLEQRIHDLRKALMCLRLEVEPAIAQAIIATADNLIDLITGRK